MTVILSLMQCRRYAVLLKGKKDMHVHVHVIKIMFDFIYLFIFCHQMKFCVNLTAFGEDLNI